MPPSPKFQLFHIQDEDDGLTLAKALKRHLPDASWGELKTAILKRRVQVNGNLCLDGARKVTPKDVVKLWNESLPKPVASDDVKIAYVDDFLVVVEKPPAVTSTRHFEERQLSNKRRQLQPTLEELLPNALMNHFQAYKAKDGRQGRRKQEMPETLRQREHRMKRFSVVAVHRLDRDTSGLMIFARTPSIAQSLGLMFRKHEVTRKYHAVVHGHPAAQTFDNILVRDRGDGVRGSKTSPDPDPTEQRAITHIRPIEKIGDYSMLECQLETGRTHQIRIHLAEAGHLLCGDPIYARNLDGSKTPDNSAAPRQALHSATLEFKHPISGETLSFKMPWPADLFRWLKELRNQA